MRSRNAPSSIAWRRGDPAELLERREKLRQLEIAQQIFKLSETQWESRVQLLPADQRPPVRRCLELLKEAEEER